VPKGDYPGEFEQIVLLAVMRLGKDAYGMQVRREIELRTGRESSVGAVYATLDRLTAKGMLRSREVTSAEARTQRLYAITAQGEQALRSAREAMERMWDGLKASL
jgi:PadR family transcriptional regulator, regulatory protein PadR